MPIKGMKGVREAIGKLESNANDQLRAIVFQGLGNIQVGTPRDEGRAINNWYLSVGYPSSEVNDEVSGNELKFEQIPDYIIGKIIYFTNNLPYIERLEYDGWSDQAEFGWVRTEINRMKAAVRKL